MKIFIALRQSQLTALLIIIALSVWMFSGRHAKTEATTDKNGAAQIVRATEISVRTRSLEAENVDKELILHGTTEPARSVTLRVEFDGRVLEVGATRDSRVQIVRAMPSELWVSGLPEQVRVITVGHGFTRPGDKVKSVDEPSIKEQATQGLAAQGT